MRAALLLGLLASNAAPASPNADGGAFVSLLRQAGLTREAGAEVERQLQLSGAADLDADSLFALGVELAHLGELPAAIRTVELAVAREVDARRADDLRLALGTLRLKDSNYPLAEGTFAKVEAFANDAELRDRAGKLGCVGHVWAQDVVPARTCVEALLRKDATPKLKARLGRTLDALGAEQAWRGWVGGVLSALIPGLGQATAGEPVDGLIALAVNGGGTVWVAALALGGDIVDASVVLVGLVARYYIGNIEHGAADWNAIAERHRKAAAEDLVQRLAALPE